MVTSSRRALVAQLRAWGCDVIDTTSLSAARRQILSETSHGSIRGLILVDESLLAEDSSTPGMPRMDMGQRVALILLVSAGSTAIYQAATEMGFHAVVTKPVRQRALLEGIAVAFGEAREGDSGENFKLEDSTVAVNLTMGQDQPLAGLHLLVAEDNDTNRIVITRMLERFGAKVTSVSHGGQVLELLEQSPNAYGAILMDCQMPGVDGFTATREIRRRGNQHPETGLATLPIIAVTAHAMDGEKAQCLASGMNDYISKPFKSSDLVRVILKRTHHSPPHS
jgi:CheY-like chemotaxis protein